MACNEIIVDFVLGHRVVIHIQTNGSNCAAKNGCKGGIVPKAGCNLHFIQCTQVDQLLEQGNITNSRPGEEKAIRARIHGFVDVRGEVGGLKWGINISNQFAAKFLNSEFQGCTGSLSKGIVNCNMGKLRTHILHQIFCNNQCVIIAGAGSTEHIGIEVRSSGERGCGRVDHENHFVLKRNCRQCNSNTGTDRSLQDFHPIFFNQFTGQSHTLFWIQLIVLYDYFHRPVGDNVVTIGIFFATGSILQTNLKSTDLLLAVEHHCTRCRSNLPNFQYGSQRNFRGSLGGGFCWRFCNYFGGGFGGYSSWGSCWCGCRAGTQDHAKNNQKTEEHTKLFHFLLQLDYRIYRLVS